MRCLLPKSIPEDTRLALKQDVAGLFPDRDMAQYRAIFIERFRSRGFGKFPR